MPMMPSKSDAKQQLSARTPGRPKRNALQGLTMADLATTGDPAAMGMLPPKRKPAPVAGMPPAPPRMKAGGSVGSASKRADGIAQQGKTRGKVL